MIAVCPKCDSMLIAAILEGIEIDFCHKCRGVWLDGGELEELAGMAPGQLKGPLVGFRDVESSGGKRKMCPRCDMRLATMVSEREKGVPIELDRCPQGHGIWFDDGELIEVLAREPSEKARKAVEFFRDMLGLKETNSTRRV